MNRLAYIFVPGVLNLPSSASAWTDRAVTWIHVRQACEVAEKFEYLALPLSRRILAERRAEQLAALIERYPIDTFSLVVVGHSNGCDVILRALWRATRPANFVHFFAPAIAVNPRQHRLVRQLREGRIGFLNIHLAGRDRVLDRGFLGGAGADAVRSQFAEEHHTTIHSDPRHGHSTYWAPAHFEDTMRRIAGPFGGTP